MQKFREEERKFIVEGWRVEEAMLSDWHIEMLIFQMNTRVENALKILHRAHISVLSISPKEFEQISDTETPQGILAVAHQKMQLTNYDSYNLLSHLMQ